jgi:hypothetical protein
MAIWPPATVCFCLRVGPKQGPEGVRGRHIRSFLSAHKRMRLYTRKCLSLCQIGFQSLPSDVVLSQRYKVKAYKGVEV